MKLRIFAIIGFALMLCLSGLRLIQVDWAERISTDVMDLIPFATEGEGTEAGREILNELYSDRVIVAFFARPETESLEAYMETLEASPLVGDVTRLYDPANMHAFIRELFQHRFEMLFPAWLNRQAMGDGVDPDQLATQSADALDKALDDPATLAYEKTIPRDPLLLSQQAGTLALESAPGADLPEGTHLLEVSLTVSTLSPAGQKPVIELLDRAHEVARAIDPSVEVLDTGAHRYAYETEQRMRAELKWLNLVSMLAVFLICGVLCRRLWLIFHIGVVVLLSVAGGLALMTSLVGEIHIFALIFGSVLCGVIVDYTLHAYWHGAGSEDKARNFKKPFLISCGSTLLGFSLLLLSELPAVRQMGLMIISCLLMAVWVTPAYVFWLLGAADKRRHATGFMASALPPAYVLLGGLLLLPFLMTVDWKDDIRELKYPLPHLDAVDSKIRSLNGTGKEVWITVGSSYADSRNQLDAFHQWLAGQGLSEAGHFSAAPWIPTYDEYRKGQQFIQAHPGFAGALIDSLEELGYEGEAFQPFQKDWRRAVDKSSTSQASYEERIAALGGHLKGGLSSLYGSSEGTHWWLTIAEHAAPLPVPPAAFKSVELNQTERFTNALEQFRERLLKLSLVGLLAVGLIVCLSFGIVRGLAILWVPALSISLSSLLTMWLTGNLNMFHLIGLFLGACLSLDYAVFTMTQATHSKRMPFSVMLSGVTTCASFAVLACSRIPAIHALGLSVVIVTLSGLLLSYFWVLPLASRKELGHGR